MRSCSLLVMFGFRYVDWFHDAEQNWAGTVEENHSGDLICGA